MPTEPTEAAPEKKAKTVRLALDAFPVDAFDHGVKGVDPLTSEGTDVPADKENDVLEAAKAAGYSVKKVSE